MALYQFYGKLSFDEAVQVSSLGTKFVLRMTELNWPSICEYPPQDNYYCADSALSS